MIILVKKSGKINKKNNRIISFMRKVLTLGQVEKFTPRNLIR
jgi:hypothetical protein